MHLGWLYIADSSFTISFGVLSVVGLLDIFLNVFLIGGRTRVNWDKTNPLFELSHTPNDHLFDG
jgi:hypothetical protein